MSSLQVYIYPSSKKDTAAKILASHLNRLGLSADVLKYSPEGVVEFKPEDLTSYVLSMTGLEEPSFKHFINIIDLLAVIETADYFKLDKNLSSIADTFKWLVENETV